MPRMDFLNGLPGWAGATTLRSSMRGAAASHRFVRDPDLRPAFAGFFDVRAFGFCAPVARFAEPAALVIVSAAGFGEPADCARELAAGFADSAAGDFDSADGLADSAAVFVESAAGLAASADGLSASAAFR